KSAPKTKKITLTIPNDPLPTLQSPAPLPDITVTQTGKALKFTLPANVKRAAFYPEQTAPFHADTGTLKSGQLHVPLTHRQNQVITGELFMDNHPPIKIHQRPRLLTSSYGPIIGALLGAFLGGLLLNIMPCVLPIIGIKALQFQRSKHIPGWRDAVYYFLGVWGTLITLYLLLVGLKSMGHLSGWGFQLQSPIIIQCLILLFVCIMAINLEIMHIPLPKKISQKKHSHMMAYGAMTTLIATPCTAPFLGTALAAALLTSSVVGFGIFTSMALGLSLPMALIITRPSWRRWLPTSGHWNRRLKFYLNGGFVITIGWFFWILSSQISMGFYTIFLSVITLFFFILYWRHPIAIPKQHLLPVILTVIMGLIPLINPAPSNRVWQPYAPAIIESLIANQTPYFIDITAKWCITCQTNKLTVLSTQKAIKYFNKKNIQLFRADWTNHSPTVTSLLAQFDKISIPTYVYFDGETHHVFGDILTMNKLKEHVK
ncbi:MAG: protein-disulfide reductase DsbD family protein, partial [Candidatus Marinamargulisbacteria bacterium]